MSLSGMLPVVLATPLAQDAAPLLVDQGMSAAHFVYIPLSIIVGLVVGFVLGRRLGRAEQRPGPRDVDGTDG